MARRRPSPSASRARRRGRSPSTSCARCWPRPASRPGALTIPSARRCNPAQGARRGPGGSARRALRARRRRRPMRQRRSRRSGARTTGGGSSSPILRFRQILGGTRTACPRRALPSPPPGHSFSLNETDRPRRRRRTRRGRAGRGSTVDPTPRDEGATGSIGPMRPARAHHDEETTPWQPPKP